MIKEIDLDFDTVDLEFDPPHKEESTEPPAEVIITPEVKHSHLLTFNEEQLDAMNDTLPLFKELGVISEDVDLDQFIDECFVRGLNELVIESMSKLYASSES